MKQMLWTTLSDITRSDVLAFSTPFYALCLGNHSILTIHHVMPHPSPNTSVIRLVLDISRLAIISFRNYHDHAASPHTLRRGPKLSRVTVRLLMQNMLIALSHLVDNIRTFSRQLKTSLFEAPAQTLSDFKF